MKKLSAFLAVLFIVFVAMALVFDQPGQASFVQQQDQIAVAILINVTPAPIVLHSAPAPTIAQQQIVAHLSLRGASPALERAFQAQNLHFISKPFLVAQNQQSVKVEAEVSPNPKATLLYSNQNSVTINAVGGTAVSLPCAYTVTVDTTRTYWLLYHGLSNDFSGAFLGGDLANNTYIQGTAPQPTSTPFIVYADNGNSWAHLSTNGLKKTYCVDLSLSVPVSIGQGAYSSNAVYTLYF